jgi:hypothetical protein
MCGKESNERSQITLEGECLPSEDSGRSSRRGPRQIGGVHAGTGRTAASRIDEGRTRTRRPVPHVLWPSPPREGAWLWSRASQARRHVQSLRQVGSVDGEGAERLHQGGLGDCDLYHLGSLSSGPDTEALSQGTAGDPDTSASVKYSRVCRNEDSRRRIPPHSPHSPHAGTGDSGRLQEDTENDGAD